MRVGAVVAIVLVGLITPGLEIQRALVLNAFGASDCNLLTTWSRLEPYRWWSSYLASADDVPAWLFGNVPAVAATVENRACWADHPFRSFPTTAWKEMD